MLVTLFPSTAATTSSETPWDSERIASLIRHTSGRTKLALPMIKLARFGEARSNHGCLRNDANLVEVTGVEGDYDGGEWGPEWAAERLRGIEALVYTTSSHRAERPKWRVLAPFAQGYEPGTRARVVSRLNGVLGGVLAPESWGLSLAYFYGSVRGQPLSEVIRVEGTPIDLVEGLVEMDSVRERRERFIAEGGPNPKAHVCVQRENIEGDPALRDACRRKVDRTVRRQEDRVANALVGVRETTLYQAACTIGGYVWSGLVDEAAVYVRLGFAARRCGLTGEHGAEWVREKIAHGLEWGAKQPLTLDDVVPYAVFKENREPRPRVQWTAPEPSRGADGSLKEFLDQLKRD